MMTEEDLRQRTLDTIDAVGIDADEVAFRSALWDAGLAMVQYPEGKGGLDLSPKMQTVVESTIRTAGRTFHPLAVNTIGIGMGLPTVLTYGTDEHHAKHLKRIYTAAAARGEKLPITFTIGSHPLDMYAATTRIPGDELSLIWGIRSYAKAQAEAIMSSTPPRPSSRMPSENIVQ